MKALFLFTQVKKEQKCKYIYAEEDGVVYNYSLDEDLIVKSEEQEFENLEEIKKEFAKKAKTKNLLVEEEFAGVKKALGFLGASKEDFDQGVPAFKKLPEIVSPYETEFDKSEDLTYNENSDDSLAGSFSDVSEDELESEIEEVDFFEDDFNIDDNEDDFDDFEYDDDKY
jgi:hypothetical protein